MSKPKYMIGHTYIKDISFENPFFVDLVKKTKAVKSDVNFNLEIKVHQAGENEFEVCLFVKVDILFEKKPYIQSEIVYAALVEVPDGPERQKILFVDIPHQCYPDMRPLVSQMFFAAGSASSFKLPIVDFSSLYERKREEYEQKLKESEEKAAEGSQEAGVDTPEEGSKEN